MGKWVPRPRAGAGAHLKLSTESPPHPPRWQPSPLVGASLGLHAAAVAALIARPSLWPWVLGALIADHALLTGASLVPRSRLLGPNWTRLPAAAAGSRQIALTIDDGPDPHVTPRVLALLEERHVKATFFCIGQRVRAHSELAREITRRGHAIENHSHRHAHYFSLLGPRGMTLDIERAQDTIGIVTGQRPVFFRAPAGLRNPFLDPVLSRLGLKLATWTRRGFDTVNASAEAVLGKLTGGLKSGDILLLHDGHAARTRTGVPIILEVLPRLLDAAAAADLAPVTLRSALAGTSAP
jgi:peptidoglycan/xylan/chitin deacetylase (PgdA/CDA1 family)